MASTYHSCDYTRGSIATRDLLAFCRTLYDFLATSTMSLGGFLGNVRPMQCHPLYVGSLSYIITIVGLPRTKVSCLPFSIRRPSTLYVALILSINPPNLLVSFSVVHSPNHYGFQHEDLELLTLDGVTLRCYLLRPGQTRPKRKNSRHSETDYGTVRWVSIASNPWRCTLISRSPPWDRLSCFTAMEWIMGIVSPVLDK